MEGMRKLVRDHPLAVTLAAFLGGYAAAYFLHASLFGYPNAETCTLHAKNRWAVGACYDLYPSVSDRSERKQRTEQ